MTSTLADRRSRVVTGSVGLVTSRHSSFILVAPAYASTVTVRFIDGWSVQVTV